MVQQRDSEQPMDDKDERPQHFEGVECVGQSLEVCAEGAGADTVAGDLVLVEGS